MNLPVLPGNIGRGGAGLCRCVLGGAGRGVQGSWGIRGGRHGDGASVYAAGDIGKSETCLRQSDAHTLRLYLRLLRTLQMQAPQFFF